MNTLESLRGNELRGREDQSLRLFSENDVLRGDKVYILVVLFGIKCKNYEPNKNIGFSSL